MTGKDLYAMWTRIWAEMLTFVAPWDELSDDERNAWAELAERLELPS